MADPLEVIEQVMRYFYGLGVLGAKDNAPIDEVQKCRALHGWQILRVYKDHGIAGTKSKDKRPEFDALHKAAARR